MIIYGRGGPDLPRYCGAFPFEERGSVIGKQKGFAQALEDAAELPRARAIPVNAVETTYKKERK